MKEKEMNTKAIRLVYVEPLKNAVNGTSLPFFLASAEQAKLFGELLESMCNYIDHLEKQLLDMKAKENKEETMPWKTLSPEAIDNIFRNHGDTLKELNKEAETIKQDMGKD